MKLSEGLRRNSNGSGGDWVWEAFGEGDGELEDDERWIPTMCRIVLTMPLNMEIDSTVLTRSAHSTPSDGDGRLERPIFFINA